MKKKINENFNDKTSRRSRGKSIIKNDLKCCPKKIIGSFYKYDTTRKNCERSAYNFNADCIKMLL